MGGINRCPPVHTFDYWYKELSRAPAGKKEAGCHVNTCGFFTCIYSILLGFSALFQEQITQAVWGQEYSWWTGHVLQMVAWASCLPCPPSQTCKARALLAFCVDGDKEEGVFRQHSRNRKQAGLANASGIGGWGTVFSLEGREGPNHRIKMQNEWLLGLFGLQVCFVWPCTVWPASYFKFKLAVNFLSIRKFHIKKVGTFTFMQKLKTAYSCISVMTDTEKQLPHKEASVGHVTIVPAVPQRSRILRPCASCHSSSFPTQFPLTLFAWPLRHLISKASCKTPSISRPCPLSVRTVDGF